MSDAPESDQQLPNPIPSTRSAWLWPAVTGVAGLLVGLGTMGGIWAASSAAATASHQAASAKAKASAAKEADVKKSILKVALAECGLSDGANSELGDGGYTLTINGQGNDDFSGLTIDEEACLIRNLKAPSAAVSHIDQTTSMDGRQTETWQGVTFSWSYHPDRGLDGVFSVQR